MDNYVDAIIKVKVPKWQIGEKVSIYFKDTMCAKGTCEKVDKCCELCKELTEVEEKLQIDTIYGNISGYFQPTTDNTIIKYCPNCGRKI